MPDVKDDQYGFEWGPVKVQRHFSDEKKGWVVFGVKTERQELQIYVTKTGKIRVYNYNNMKEYFTR